MNLGFKPRFVPFIFSGSKKHTIRTDSTNRWKAGMKIHFATGIRTKNYDCFKQGVCISTQTIEIVWKINNKGKSNESWGVQVYIDGNNVTNEADIIDQLAKNDGFHDRKEFFEWEEWNKKYFKGKIIHWTNLKY